MKLSTTCLTAIMVCSVSGAIFAHEAPVVDAQQQQETVSTQAETVTGGSWQPVSPNSDASSQNSWQPVDNQSNNAQPTNTYQSSTPMQEASAAPAPSGSVKKRIARLEQQIANYNQMNLPQQITDLQQQNAQLQGQLEVAQHNLKTVTDQQKLYYQDLEQQITQLGGQKNKSIQLDDNTNDNSNELKSDNSATKNSSSHFVERNNANDNNFENKQQSQLAQSNQDDQKNKISDSSSDQTDQGTSINLLNHQKTPSLSDADAYDKAFRSLSNKHFNAAQTEFNAYLTDYPRGHFAVNAHFWMGEIALMHQKYDIATKQFQAVVTDYPKSSKVPDAKLKIAMIHAAKGQMDEARTEFMQIRKDYPGSTAAQLANIRLQQLANATSVNIQ